MIIHPEVLRILNTHQVYLTPDEIAQLLDRLQARENIAAIKLMRQETGLGLKETKDIVDALALIIRPE
jgi:ribosomal protein L7/L12